MTIFFNRKVLAAEKVGEILSPYCPEEFPLKDVTNVSIPFLAVFG